MIFWRVLRIADACAAARRRDRGITPVREELRD